jgi:acylpyruvate hydrolase
VFHDGEPLLVALVDGSGVPVRGATELGEVTPSSFLAEPELDFKGALPQSELVFRPVVPRPGKVICVGLNYAEHAAEAQRSVPDYPALFAKFASTLTGPYDDVTCPPESSAVDYEGELAIVIGKACRRVSSSDIGDVVAGVTVANDVTMRDFQNFTHQWLPGKAWEASTPIGPALVTLDELGDLSDLRLQTSVNGLVVQDTSIGSMVRDVAALISTISVFTALEPGDLILTGTPSGVGFRREPPLLLGPGDRVSVEISGVGRLENRFVADPTG